MGGQETGEVLEVLRGQDKCMQFQIPDQTHRYEQALTEILRLTLSWSGAVLVTWILKLFWTKRCSNVAEENWQI